MPANRKRERGNNITDDSSRTKNTPRKRTRMVTLGKRRQPVEKAMVKDVYDCKGNTFKDALKKEENECFVYNTRSKSKTRGEPESSKSRSQGTTLRDVRYREQLLMHENSDDNGKEGHTRNTRATRRGSKGVQSDNSEEITGCSTTNNNTVAPRKMKLNKRDKIGNLGTCRTYRTRSSYKGKSKHSDNSEGFKGSSTVTNTTDVNKSGDKQKVANKKGRKISNSTRHRNKSVIKGDKCVNINKDKTKNARKVNPEYKKHDNKGMKHDTCNIKAEHSGRVDLCPYIEFLPARRYLGRVSMKCPEDTAKDGSLVRGLVVTSGDKLIVTDQSNKAIKMVDCKRDRILYRLATTASPRGVTIVPENKVAVTVPEDHKIMLIRVNDTSLLPECDIETGEKYHDIVFHQNTFLATCVAPRGIHTISMEGEVLRSFEVFDDRQQSVFTHRPTFLYTTLSLDQQSVYMTDTCESSITQISLGDQRGVQQSTMDGHEARGPLNPISQSPQIVCQGTSEGVHGQVLNRYAHYDIHDVMGVAVDNKNGYVYVGSWAKERGLVTKFNSDLSNPQIFLDKKDNIRLPCPLYINRETDVLYVSNSMKPINEFVSLFDIGHLPAKSEPPSVKF